ncbi:MAG: hypothetical protein HYZ20_19645 [Burkholderiales bacterium]|nr:hypothetical protein [Burkholderiales bacterium]
MTRTISNPGFSPKDPSEVLDLGFDFASLTAAPLSPVVTIARHAGADDPAPEAVLSGAPNVSGATVIQRVLGGVAGTDYVLRCQVQDATGQIYVLSGVLPVRAA